MGRTSIHKGPSGTGDSAGNFVAGDKIWYYPMKPNKTADDDPVNSALQFQDPNNKTGTMAYLERTLAWNGTWIPVVVSYCDDASLCRSPGFLILAKRILKMFTGDSLHILGGMLNP